jgi:hypothetical protein
MKRTVFLLLFVAMAGAVIAQPKNNKGKDKQSSPKATEDTYILSDFRDIKWGTHIDSVFREDGTKTEFVKSTEYGDKNAYYIPNDDLMIGTVVLKNLYYVFNDNGRFVGVVMMGDSKHTGEMKYILVNKFGQPGNTEEGASSKQYYWVVDDVRISLTNENINQVFTAEFASDYELNESKRVNRNVDDF